MKKVVIIGTGNVATILSKMIHQAGHHIVQIIGRNIDKAQKIAQNYQADFSSLDAETLADADLYIIALADDALNTLKLPGIKNRLVVHTAGSVSIDVLKTISKNYGILYPLQTLSAHSSLIPEVSFLINGNDEQNIREIFDFASTLSEKVTVTNDEQRLKYHIAAVFVCNFVNHLFALGEKYCLDEGLNFKMLLPLINEVNRKVNEASPMQSQTGPAVRNDQMTLMRHLTELKNHPQYQKIYQLLSESIIDFHHKK